MAVSVFLAFAGGLLVVAGLWLAWPSLEMLP